MAAAVEGAAAQRTAAEAAPTGAEAAPSEDAAAAVYDWAAANLLVLDVRKALRERGGNPTKGLLQPKHDGRLRGQQGSFNRTSR